jgi:hypothetical protein
VVVYEPILLNLDADYIVLSGSPAAHQSARNAAAFRPASARMQLIMINVGTVSASYQTDGLVGHSHDDYFSHIAFAGGSGNRGRLRRYRFPALHICNNLLGGAPVNSIRVDHRRLRPRLAV